MFLNGGTQHQAAHSAATAAPVAKSAQATTNLLILLHIKRNCPTHACTTPGPVVGDCGLSHQLTLRTTYHGVASVASERWWSRHGVAASHSRCGPRLQPTPNPSHTLSPALATVFATFSACILTPLVRLVQVHIWATLAAAMRDFYCDSKDDTGGY